MTKPSSVSPGRPLEWVLRPADNLRLANLCGPLDENLRQIEAGLDVVIARRGERFTLRGEAAEQAREALEYFYARSTESLTVDDVQLGLIEIRNAPIRRISTTGNAVDGPQLVTRKAELRGRTPRQVEYLKHIQEHDITFGVGPAGTGKTYLAVASAVDAFERDLVERIILTRPAVEAGERLGFL
ncbi:MAG: PhoH family protein, partial [Azovibrio sp.]